MEERRKREEEKAIKKSEEEKKADTIDNSENRMCQEQINKEDDEMLGKR